MRNKSRPCCNCPSSVGQIYKYSGAVLLFFCMAWFSYLHLDGVTIHHMLEERKKKKPVRKSYTDIVDFADEHIVSFDELSGEERAVCSMSANLICGALFMLPWLVKFLGDFL